ncbi:MAG: GntR family transcriptional regulator [Ethanoligenens sp.]|uniref:GntR family transcriptional regulator n=1 Tax=Ethanoligenens sp. TaxID=2099655 RepID=UPI0039EA2C8C
MITISKQSPVPVYEQIITQFQRLILLGDLPENTRIPSVRALSLKLSVNPNTVQKAYNELELKHITYSVPGVGRYVHPQARGIIEKQYEAHLGTLYNAAYALALAGIPKEKAEQQVEAAYRAVQNYLEKREKP